MGWSAVLWILVALAIVAGALRRHFYAQWFRLPADRSDLLKGRDCATRVEVTLDADGVSLPPGSLANRSVLLRLTLRARWSGHLFDPYIEMRTGDLTARQYFERGTSGERYLNLSPMFQHDPRAQVPRIALRARGLHWKMNGTLESYPAPRLEGARILVLAPHPDDAELAAYGVYAGRGAWVATITAGERGGANAADRPSRRIEESLAVPQLAAVPAEQTISLAFPDGALARMYQNPASAFRLACEESRPRASLRSLNVVPEFRVATADCRWNDLIAELRTLLAMVRPDIVVVPHPLLDAHPDHVFTAVALEAAMRQSDIFPELFLYAVHIAGAPMHPHGDAASVVGLPPIRESEWIAEQIHSHPLDAAARLAKRRSLLAMSAVRESAGLDPAAAARGSAWQRLRNLIAGVGTHPASLLRRAERPNEIYYRVRGREFAALVGRVPATGS